MKPQAMQKDMSLVAVLSHERQDSLHNLKLALWVAVGLTLTLWGGIRMVALHRPAPKGPIVDGGRIIILNPTELKIPPAPVIEESKPAIPPPGHIFGQAVPTDITEDLTYTRNDSARDWQGYQEKTGDSLPVYLPPKPPDNDIPEVGYHPILTVEPVPLEMRLPEYPALARQLHQEGKVFILCLLDHDGSVMQTRLYKTSGYEVLDDAAVAGAKNFKFSPAKQGNQTVRVWVSIPVNFRLEN